MTIAYQTGTRLGTIKFLNFLKKHNYKIDLCFDGEEYSVEHFINITPPITEYILVDHERKTALLCDIIVGMDAIFICNDMPRPNPYTRKNAMKQLESTS